MNNYSVIGIDELLAERAAMDQEIRRRAQTELTALEQRKAQLLAIVGDAPTKAVAKGRTAVAAPKYRRPDSAETWAGCGKKPGWMQAWIAEGKDPNDLLIDRHPELAVE